MFAQSKKRSMLNKPTWKALVKNKKEGTNIDTTNGVGAHWFFKG
jgi:hypothetical protein